MPRAQNFLRFMECASEVRSSLPILMAGGIGNSGSPVGTAELYTIGGASSSTPYNGSSAATGAMSTPRYDHTATFLASTSNSTMPTTCAGQVLITGGFDSSGTVLNTAEVYSSGAFTAVTTNMVSDRVYHTATRVGVSEATRERCAADGRRKVSTSAGAAASLAVRKAVVDPSHGVKEFLLEPPINLGPKVADINVHDIGWGSRPKPQRLSRIAARLTGRPAFRIR